MKFYRPPRGVRVLTEFIGTFYLTLTVGMGVLNRSAFAAWAAGAVVVSMIYAVGDISGGHFNPAITLGVVLCRKVDITYGSGFLYVLFQLFAAIFAAFSYSLLNDNRSFRIEPRHHHTDAAAYILEIIFTFLLTFTVLATAYLKNIKTRLSRNYYFGIAVGLTFAGGCSAAEKVSGGFLNPAVSLGASIAHILNDGDIFFGMTYAIAEFVGAAAAVFIFAIVYVEVYAPSKQGTSMRNGVPTSAQVASVPSSSSAFRA